MSELHLVKSKHFVLSIGVHAAALLVVPLMLQAAALRQTAAVALAAEAPANSKETSPIPTSSYARPVRLLASGNAIDIGSHATTRCFDWDDDDDLDLVVGGGDGRLWLFLREDGQADSSFTSKRAISAGKRVRWGESYTGAVLHNVVGDSRPDLIVCHSDHQVSIHENVATAAQPVFAEDSLDFQVQNNCQGRFDVADWDRDGLPDLITGSFSGELQWHRNDGQRGKPTFGQGRTFQDIKLAYNAHPRLMDFNQDGLLDLLLGVNWGTVSLYLNEGTVANPILRASSQFRWADDGINLNLRKLNGDDTTPEIADLDADGVLDLVSGGKNGQLFLMRGVGYPTKLTRFSELLAKHPDDLGQQLARNKAIRDETFGLLRSIRSDLSGGLIPQGARTALFRQLEELLQVYPQYLRRRPFKLDTAPHLPLLQAQYHVLVLDSSGQSPEQRQRVADMLGFVGGYRRLLVDLGVVFIDNHQASAEQLDAMHRLLTSIPSSIWDVQTITVADWLGPAVKSQRIASRSGINIFALPLGRAENSFPMDSPRPGVTDVYLICLAHEIAHNMLDTVGRRERPELFAQKFRCLKQAAGPDVAFQSPISRGIDWTATKARFREISVWDSNEAGWRDAFSDYFQGKEKFDRAYLRGNVHFFLNAPQEAFATLANQYFADSQLMLEFSKVRWDAGHRSNVNQFLLITDYISAGKNGVNFYKLSPGGRMSVEEVKLTRDRQGRIAKIETPSSAARFEYGGDNLVTSFHVR